MYGATIHFDLVNVNVRLSWIFGKQIEFSKLYKLNSLDYDNEISVYPHSALMCYKNHLSKLSITMHSTSLKRLLHYKDPSPSLVGSSLKLYKGY